MFSYKKKTSYRIRKVSDFPEAYGHVNDFLKSLSDMDRLIEIEIVQFNNNNNTEEKPEFSVYFKTYYAPTLSILSGEMPEETYQAPAGRTSPFED